MPKQEELVILVDKDDNELGTAPREQAEEKKSNIIRMVYVILYDQDAKVVLQRRSADLKRFPNYWTVSANGAVFPKEGYVQAAQRKLQDELGVQVPVVLAKKSVMEIPGKASRMVALFTAPIPDLGAAQPNEEKVKEIRLVSVDDAVQGYLLTPSCEDVLLWWKEHAKEIMKSTT